MLIAIVCTSSVTNPSNPGSLRAEIDGWTCEDTSLFVDDKPIGFTPSPHPPRYKTILEYLAFGWKLLAPPVKEEYETDPANGPVKKIIQYEWWLTKGV